MNIKASAAMAILLLSTPAAFAASGQPVLHASTSVFGPNFPDCTFFQTTGNGTTSDDGNYYMFPANSGGGGAATGFASGSDLMGSGGTYSTVAKIKFIVLPSTSAAYAVTAAVCPVGTPGYVAVGQVGWQ